MRKTLREKSKIDFDAPDTSSYESLNAGSLQRIADATELIAGEYMKIKDDLKWYKEMYASHKNLIGKLTNSNAALKGHVTRLKNKQNAHCPGCNCNKP